MSIENIFENIPATLDLEVFESIIENDHLSVERIISRGHRSPATGWYDQPKNEWVLLLKGEALLILEPDKEIHLKPGDHLKIPAHCKHKVSWTSANSETIWLGVHYQ